MNLFLEVKLSDGLGNQLFQYAAGRSLSIKNKTSYVFYNIERLKDNNIGRQFGLNNFKTNAKIIKSSFVERVFRKNTRYNRLLNRLPFYKYISEDLLLLQNLQQRSRIVTSLDGYWQSEYYFKDIRPTLIKELVPIDIHSLPDWTNKKNTVAVHIRRADYLTDGRFGVLGENYYKEAMDMMRDKMQDSFFVFFSDDINWCKQKFVGNNILFCDEKEWGKDYHQLYLMSKCSHQIIANSSFSWWGAWLNTNEEKIVIRPATPFIDNSLQNEWYYPTEWISIINR